MAMRLLFLLISSTFLLVGCDDTDSKGIVSTIFLSEEVINVSEPLGTFTFSGGKTLELDVGIGSGAFHFKDDKITEFYTITDRGPNISCGNSEEILNVKDFCQYDGKVDEESKIFPMPDYRPKIYKFSIATSGVVGAKVGYDVIETLEITDRDGDPVRGLTNPLKVTTTEKGYDSNGNLLDFDPEGIDTEALVKLSDGTFWVAEEYAPSLLHISATGRILERLVPEGVQYDLADANYDVIGMLPAILKKRQLNRGIESLAVSPEEEYLYFIMQSPLANPDSDTFEDARHVRLFKISLRNGNADKIIGEYVYVLDKPQTFPLDNKDKQAKVKISEMVALDYDKLIILERITQQTKLYQVKNLDAATNILGTNWDNEKTSPSLEQLTDLMTQTIIPVGKKLVFDSKENEPDLAKKIEGIAVLNDEYVALINDNDFGIEGDQSRIHVKKLYDQLNQ